MFPNGDSRSKHRHILKLFYEKRRVQPAELTFTRSTDEDAEQFADNKKEGTNRTCFYNTIRAYCMYASNENTSTIQKKQATENEPAILPPELIKVELTCFVMLSQEEEALTGW